MKLTRVVAWIAAGIVLVGAGAYFVARRMNPGVSFQVVDVQKLKCAGQMLPVGDHGQTPRPPAGTNVETTEWKQLEETYLGCVQFSDQTGERQHALTPTPAYCTPKDVFHPECQVNVGSLYPAVGADQVTCEDIDASGLVIATIHAEGAYHWEINAGDNYIWIRKTKGTCGSATDGPRYELWVISRGNGKRFRRTDGGAVFTAHVHDSNGNIVPKFKQAVNACNVAGKKACFFDTVDERTVSRETAIARYNEGVDLLKPNRAEIRRLGIAGFLLRNREIAAKLRALGSQYWIMLNGICTCSGPDCH